MPEILCALMMKRTAMLRTAITTVALLFVAPLAASAGPMLVKDFGVEPPTIDVSGGIAPQSGNNGTAEFTHGGSLVYFVSHVGTGHGSGLWRSDGTPAGTFQLTSSDAYIPTYINGTVFFVTDDGIHGSEVWRTDGTLAGTTMVADIGGSSGGAFVYASGVVYFLHSADTTSHLWKTDGTPAGTSEVKDVAATQMTAAGRTLFFIVGSALWISDGTTAGTVAVKSFIDPPSRLVAVGERLFFTVRHTSAFSGTSEDQLWTSDGTPAGTIRLNTFPVIHTIAEFHGALYFRANTDPDLSVNGLAYWRSDGTVAGTVKVSDVPFEFEAAQNVPSATVNGVFYYAGSDSKHGRELWRSDDGTEANATLVKDINPGQHDSSPHSLVDANGTLYFYASDASNLEGLWRSDGTAAGTVKLHQFDSPSLACGGLFAGTCLTPLASAGSSVVFSANDLVHGPEPWGSDGTVAGTQLTYDLQVSNYATAPDIQTIDAAGTALLLVSNTPSSDGLWKTDGTNAGTVLLKSLAGAGGATITAGGITYFIVSLPSQTSCQIWKTDGTPGGTAQVSDLDPCGGPEPVFPDGVHFAALGNTVFFAAQESGAWGLWRSDGTPSGTALVKAGVTPAYAINLPIAATDSLVFFLNQGLLWKTDGTPAGTVAISGGYELVNPGNDPNHFAPGSYLTAAGSHVFFDTNSSGCPTCRYLTVSDGTSAQVISGDIDPIVSPRASAVVGGNVFFTGGQSGGLWRSDGTSGGTYLVKDMSVKQLTNAGGTLFLWGFDGTTAGLWTSDGTAAGTMLVPSSPGFFDSDLFTGPLTQLSGVVFFVGGTSTSDLAVWRSDGTAAGTGTMPGLPTISPTAVGSDLFVDGIINSTRGLWVVANAAHCGNGVMDAGEQCDDGNATNTDGCTNYCALNVCGDGLIDVGVEDCDDGNTANGDCCSATCQFEAATSTCGPDVPPCGAEQCDVAGNCLLTAVNAGTTCRDSGGGCDVPDACDGVQPFCPVTDAVVSSGTVCRASAGVCDVTEYCDGFTAACAADAFQDANVACRPPDGPCDPGGWCTGSDADCPNFVPCQQALTEKSKLAIKDDVDPSKRALSWQWKSSGPVTVADLGNPTAATDYTICVIDQTGGPNTVELYATAPANGFCAGKPCWAFKGNAYKYKDKDLTPDGLMSVQAKAGDAGKASIKVKGKGANLSLAGLPLTTPVTVRLLRSDAPACWEATFSSSALNTGTAFKATGD